MTEPPNVELMLLALDHVRAGAWVHPPWPSEPGMSLVQRTTADMPSDMCEGCGTALPDHNDNAKCDECMVATECEDCSADVGTVEIGRNGGKCDDCAEDPHQAYETEL